MKIYNLKGGPVFGGLTGGPVFGGRSNNNSECKFRFPVVYSNKSTINNYVDFSTTNLYSPTVFRPSLSEISNSILNFPAGITTSFASIITPFS